MYNTPVYSPLTLSLKPVALSVLLGLCVLTGACGKKGPLYLPPTGGDTQTIPAPVPPPDSPQP